jgi:capsular polysaccharide biosynthesis protein
MKRIAVLRAIRRYIGATSDTLRFQLHRLLGQLWPTGALIGSPRRKIETAEHAAADANRILNTDRQRYALIYGGTQILNPVLSVTGEPPSGFVNSPQSLPIREFVLDLSPARFFVRGQAVVSPSDALIGDCSAHWGGGLNNPAFRIIRPGLVRRLAGRTVYLFNTGGNYYHLLIDVLPRLHLLERYGTPLESFDHILLPPPKQPFEEELYQHFRIPIVKLIDASIADVFECERLVVPTMHNRKGRWHLDWLREQIGVRDASRVDRRLFISRSKAALRRIVNESVVSQLLIENGFEIVDSATLTVRQQIQLFAEASHVVSLHGAGLTNLAFCRPGTSCLEIRPRTPIAVADCYRLMTSELGIHHHLLFCDHIPNPLVRPDDVDVLVNTSDLAESLHQMGILSNSRLG